jgi:hypothetical protein
MVNDAMFRGSSPPRLPERRLRGDGQPRVIPASTVQPKAITTAVTDVATISTNVCEFFPSQPLFPKPKRDVSRQSP